MIRRLLVSLPARVMMPLLLVIASVLVGAIMYGAQVREYGQLVEAAERLRLEERLRVEQTRLDQVRGAAESVKDAQMVAELGMMSGVTHAYLVDAASIVIASLRPTDMGKPLPQVLADEEARVQSALRAASSSANVRSLAVWRPDGDVSLVGTVPIEMDRRLLVRLDLTQPVIAREIGGRGDLLRHALTLLALTAGLLALLHVLWFRRTAQLIDTVEAIAGGRLDARSGIDGRDELGIIATAIDRMATELQARETGLERLSSLINRSPVVAIEWRNEPGWPVSFVSDSVSRWGYAVEDFSSAGFTYLELIHPDDRQYIAEQVAVRLAGGPDDYRQEYRLRTADGRWIWVDDRTWLTRNAQGRVSRIHGVLQDITERKCAEDALRLHKERLEAAEAHASLGSWEFDIVTRTGWWSVQMFALIGLDPAHGIPPREEYLECVHPDDRDVVARALKKIGAGEMPEDAVFRTNPERGQVRWLSPTTYRENDAEGRPAKLAGTMLDITQIRAAEREVLQLNAELEARVAERTAQLEVANRELESFSYSVSHDLKAPLRGIDGYSQLLLEGYSDTLDDEGKLFLRNVRAGVTQMHDLIEDMLAYSRMERSALDTRTLDLQAVVRSVVDSRRGERADEVLVREDVPPLEVRADRDGLTLVLRNLLENALKFSKGMPRAEVEVGARDTGTALRLWVRDHGIGFDMKYHDRIFEIFQRLHRAEDFPGTGVGLALVKKAVTRMGGKVWAESRPGEGAVFYIEFPR